MRPTTSITVARNASSRSRAERRRTVLHRLPQPERAPASAPASGSPAKLDFARAHGADVAVDYTDDEWPEQVRKAAPDGVDVVLDSVGGQTLHRSIELLAPLGRAVVYGAASGELAEMPVRSLFELKSVVGFSTLAWRAARPDQAAQDMAELTEHFAAGRLRATVHTRLPLTDAVEAHRLLDDRAQLGRILLVP